MKMIFAEEVKEYVKRSREITANVSAIFTVIWGQCIKALSGYTDAVKKNNCFWLLANIQSITLQFDDAKHAVLSLVDAHRSFFNCKQLPGQSIDEFADTLIGWADTIESHKGTIGVSLELIPDVDAAGLRRTLEARKAIAREQTLATVLVKRADSAKYGSLVDDLANRYSRGIGEYQMTMAAAKKMLVKFKGPRLRTAAPAAARTGNQAPTTTAAAATTRSNTTGTTHVQNAASTATASDSTPATPAAATTPAPATTLTQHAVVLAANDSNQGIDPNWILLDSQSTISVFRNPAMLSNIRPSPHTMRAMTNGGHQDSNMVGDFPNLGEVWYNPHSIANILSLSDVRKVCRVTMDSDAGLSINVHRLDGSIMPFIEHPSGLYVYNPNPNDNVSAYTLLSTVAEQKRLFSRREIEAADEARALCRKLGRPGDDDFIRLLANNNIQNCPVTPADAKRATIIYGPDIATLKGKTTRSSAAPRAPTFIAEVIPPHILEHHRDVTLCIDFFFVQGMPFFHTISRGIGFRTAHPVPDRNRSTILRRLRHTIKMYQARGFTVRDVHCDHEFECIRSDLLPIAMNVVPADSHVGEVERSIRTIKERLRASAHGLPFKRLPRLFVHHMVFDTIRCLNQFPWRNGISDTLSPASIVTGTGTPNFHHMRLELGTYVQVFEDNSPSNTLRARSLGAIALTPTGNAQGDYFFLSLATGHRLSRHTWTALPLPDTAIARVEALALHEQQPLLQSSGLVVEWRPDQPIDDSEYDLDFVPPPDPAPVAFHADDYDAIDDTELADLLAANPFAPLAHDPQAQGAILSDDDDDNDDESNDADEDDYDNDDNQGAYLNNDEPGAIIDDNEPGAIIDGNAIFANEHDGPIDEPDAGYGEPQEAPIEENEDDDDDQEGAQDDETQGAPDEEAPDEDDQGAPEPPPAKAIQSP